MLGERTRNVIVGLTMLAALAALMMGIFLLGRFPQLHNATPYTVTLVSPNAAGIARDNRVDFNGVQIGSVRQVRLASDMRSVEVELAIDAGVNIPENALAAIERPPTLGSSYVTLHLPPAPPATMAVTRPAAGETIKSLPKDGSARLTATAGDGSLIPKAIIDKITTVAENLDLLLKQRSLAEYEQEDPAKRVANISILVQQINRSAESLNAVIGDPATQKNVKDALANLEAASVSLKDLMKDARATIAKVNTTVDDFGTAAKSMTATSDKIGVAATQATSTLETTQVQIVRVSDRLAETLKNMQDITDKMNKGEGTAGRLVNDAHLYDALLDLSKSLKSTTDDLNVLVRKWKEEGLRLNLK